MEHSICRFRSVALARGAAALVTLGGCATSPAPEPAGGRPATRSLPVVDLDEKPAFPLAGHLESKDLAAGTMPVSQIVEAGSKLFATPFNGLDGVGMERTVGGAPLNRFSAGPAGGGQPITVGAQACGSCHGMPFRGGAGLAHTRVVFDPGQKGVPPFSGRATTSLFGDGVLQLLAEQMTEQLLAARDAAAADARAKPGAPARAALEANGVDFGTIAAIANAKGEVSFDVSEVRGVSPDLVVRPMGWKGNQATLRDFSVGASTFAMGMEPEEFVWRLGDKAGTDPDGDGVSRELSVGDITAMTVYNAALPVPVELGRASELGFVAAPDAAAKGRIERGRAVFEQVGCATCHVPEMRLAKTVFEEPTLAGGGNYVDRFLVGKDPDYDPKRPVRVDLLKDSLAPRLEPAPGGGAIVRLYGDLKRHDMGRRFADPSGPIPPFDASLAPLKYGGQPALIPASVFLTPELWGVGSTGPYLHDDRAGTLAEAIALHGEDSPPPPGSPGRSEAQEARDAYLKLGADDRRAVVAFLRSLVNVSSEPQAP